MQAQGGYTTGHTNHPVVVATYHLRWEELAKEIETPTAEDVWGSFSVCPICTKMLNGAVWRKRAFHIKNCVVRQYYRTRNG